MPVPENIDFAKKQSYLSGFLGKQRPLNSIEISHLFSELQRNLQRNAMCIGFSQVARSEQVQRYMEKGKEIASIHVKTFSSLLMNNNLPVSMTWDSGVTESKISPFSDKLMMQQIRSSNVVLSASYGRALSVVRHDLMVVFLQLQAEILKFLEDGLKIIIENGWFEKPPQAKEHLH
ncbi:DUF3231 family protein [Desulfofarcimen acetoxidans]|uniref:DUF3231 family protein n=1 Tax=Desulfofarcimen acetoxidans TaxID=58138 RepID=UPI0030EC31D9